MTLSESPGRVADLVMFPSFMHVKFNLSSASSNASPCGLVMVFSHSAPLALKSPHRIISPGRVVCYTILLLHCAIARINIDLVANRLFKEFNCHKMLIIGGLS